MAIKTDHVLIALSGLVISLTVMAIGWSVTDPVSLIRHDCALFYGELGLTAEVACRSQMLDNHGLPQSPLAQPLPSAAPDESGRHSNMASSIASPSLQ
ncbi:MAG: hypothetical protein JO001_00475 [Alphaproteobacteria bacterium]|nr:hypothetical protein [Alphaproteobacteria bacterium]